MVRAGSLRKRYVVFSYRGPPMTEDQLRRGLYSEALEFFGELGLSLAALKLMEFDSASGRGLLRCRRDYLDKVLGFLALVSSLDGSAARLVALKSSGTLKSLGMDEASTHSR
jgi:RNase P/RNase MRP subunit POP5